MDSKCTLTPIIVALLALGLLVCAPGKADAGPVLVEDLPSESREEAPSVEQDGLDAIAGSARRVRRVRRHHRLGHRHRHFLHRRAGVHLHGHGHVALVAARRAAEPPPTFSMGVGAALALAFDDWIDADEVGESVGVVMPFRWRALRWLGVTYDLGLVWRVGDDHDDQDAELRVHHGVGIAWYPFAGGWVDPFVSGGATLASVHIDHSRGESDYFEWGGFIGLGTEMYFGNWRGVTLETRLTTLHRTDEDDIDIDRPGYSRRAPTDRLAAMFHAIYQFNLY